MCPSSLNLARHWGKANWVSLWKRNLSILNRWHYGKSLFGYSTMLLPWDLEMKQRNLSHLTIYGVWPGWYVYNHRFSWPYAKCYGQWKRTWVCLRYILINNVSWICKISTVHIIVAWFTPLAIINVRKACRKDGFYSKQSQKTFVQDWYLAWVATSKQLAKVRMCAFTTCVGGGVVVVAYQVSTTTYVGLKIMWLQNFWKSREDDKNSQTQYDYCSQEGLIKSLTRICSFHS